MGSSIVVSGNLVLIASIWAVIIYTGGIVTGIWIKERRRKKVPSPYVVEEQTIKVPRKKPSLRNPMRTYDTRYDDFRTKRGLYEPVKPKGGSAKDEIEA